jgi:hypothetical protein
LRVASCFRAAVAFFAMIGNPFESATFVGTGLGNVCVELYLTR